MTREVARSADRTLFGTTGMPGALRIPPMASGEPSRMLSSTPFQSSSGECRFKGRARRFHTRAASRELERPRGLRLHVGRGHHRR